MFWGEFLDSLPQDKREELLDLMSGTKHDLFKLTDGWIEKQPCHQTPKNSGRISAAVSRIAF